MPTKPITRKKARSPFQRPRNSNDSTTLRACAFGKSYFTDENYNYMEWYKDQSRKIVTRIVEHIRPKKDCVFLDIGCALGGIVEVLRRRNYEAYGVDLSKWCISHSPVRKYLRFGSVTNLPCADQSVDVTICIDTLQYLNREEANRAIREFRRVTRKYLCFECITWEDEKFSDPKENPDTVRKHTSLFTRDELIELFTEEGFKIKKLKFLPRKIVGSVLRNQEYYEYDFSFNAIFEVTKTATTSYLSSFQK